MDYIPVRTSNELREKAARLAQPGEDGPGPWVQVEGDLYARKWGHAPSTAPGSGTLEIARFTGPSR
jgi:hypothetical protein